MTIKVVINISSKLICFDLEGPLTPRDNAYDLMKLFPDGDKIFEVISRYDDLLTMEGRYGYEPGDTLALIVPFLVLHNISEADIAASARRTTLTGGAEKLVSALKAEGWQVFCITTTYEQYAHYVTDMLGIPSENVACTPFPLDKYKEMLCNEDTFLLQAMEKDILNIADDDTLIKNKLDVFFWKSLPRTRFGKAIREVKPVGGWRKVEALKNFCRRLNCSLSEWAVIGDSITDCRILKEVDKAEGVSVAYNANQYALPYATMSLASTDISDLMPVLQTWQEKGRQEAGKFVLEMAEKGCNGDRNCFHWLAEKKNMQDIIALHRGLRKIVREEAGKLG